MIEVEYIPVGEKTDTGDAILCHFTEPGTSTNRVVLIDGGFASTADAIVAHVRKYYGTDRIDLMICTHPDEDHINGLFGVLEQLYVTELVIHRPSDYGYTSDDVASDKVEELIRLAKAEGTVVSTNYFAGTSFFSDSIRIAGPSESYYQSLLSEQETGTSAVSKAGGLFRSVYETIRNALSPRSTDPGEGTLTDNGGTTARNNTSVILDVQVDAYRVLLTGDAGAPALTRAADYLDSTLRNAIGLPSLFDVPHHGSRHNLTTDVMNRLAGPVEGATQSRSAFVSVGKLADEFPRPEVANAFTRRGYSVCVTRGQTIRWSRNAGFRQGWTSLTPLTWLEPDE
ncbi:hypothetical protein DEJ27_12125 [Curtobacterium sp. MCPF17_018]|uniref:ComEC/Rec2 family competence protein n=1 Tax=Curtobacterium sp. MCPF17_018 TaxID=2175638 RepID=UPI000DA8D63F|nr:MBL fold metallo-hydrolase [Curtobacterium sp. MCPF17_018]PZE67364.1 hypothetical protein DEJ27_12125 [Curtobacterium sp. MCPF17_018]